MAAAALAEASGSHAAGAAAVSGGAEGGGSFGGGAGPGEGLLALSADAMVDLVGQNTFSVEEQVRKGRSP